ncbi:DUF4446 family protein [Paenibacillus rigui]|uniref:DUF4446 domain-containing protein n=1 Tax=Paenibacillus rigui TaxID=554312 RepID=A0A229UM90_9BACL|nr:DUF4446 family protein [Paenibacillus rigui]OXM84530.1 hypothetical protein CF651_20020 [Paenibacillus rigui]
MGEILDLIDMKVVLIAFAFILIVFIVLMLVLWSKLNKLRAKYMSMLNGAGTMNVEEALIELQGKATALNGKTDTVQQQITLIQQQMKKMKSNIGIHRYNAFAESGSDLSFSVAILDEELDGVVLTGIHNREETYVYAKPIQQGQSSYTLSPEEKEAIHRGSQKK